MKNKTPTPPVVANSMGQFIAIRTPHGTELVQPLEMRDNLFYHRQVIKGEPQKDYAISSDISSRLLLMGISSKKKADQLLIELAASPYNWHLGAEQLIALPIAEKRGRSLFLTGLIEKYGMEIP